VGFGRACSLSLEVREGEASRLAALRARLLAGITGQLPDVTVNGSLEHRLPGNLNLSFACVEGEALLLALRDVALSSGSACTSASLEPSYVLRAMGVADDLAHASLRFGLGRGNTEDDVDHVVKLVVEKVRRLRALSPAWEARARGAAPGEAVR
jgi:cysteine desulfurase